LCKKTLFHGSLIKERYVLKDKHNHSSEPYVNIFNLKCEMVQMCRETTATNKEIFDSVSRKNPAVAANISFPWY